MPYDESDHKLWPYFLLGWSMALVTLVLYLWIH